MLARVKQLRSEGKWVGPSKVNEEMQYNVFMRSVFEPKMLELTGTSDVVSCMKFLREFKNTGGKPSL